MNALSAPLGGANTNSKSKSLYSDLNILFRSSKLFLILLLNFLCELMRESNKILRDINSELVRINSLFSDNYSYFV
jgi:hypothetical protein